MATVRSLIGVAPVGLADSPEARCAVPGLSKCQWATAGDPFGVKRHSAYGLEQPHGRLRVLPSTTNKFSGRKAADR